MSANGISHLQYKKQRQAAKLEQAKADRIAANKTRTNYDVTQLPMQYATNDNDTSHSVDNPNPGGLVVGRPWTT